mmetsp:Transcript_6597/g.15038  ORF Transcript_6597/g.15038 Transcript_6597/m.15038 type:complete len:318 (-) Transcript_6597:886-1839(-)
MMKTKTPILMRVRTTTIRATSDIYHKSNGQQQLFPAAALRLCDHHLHSSNIIPRIRYHPDNAPNRIYEHDWFCVSQAVQCYNANTESPLLHRVLNGTDACHCDVWVDTDSIGKSSVQFGGVVSVGRDVLAVVRRIFVRMAIPVGGTEETGGKSKPAPFSNLERQRFCHDFGFASLNIGENYKTNDGKKIKDLIEVKRPEFRSGRLEAIISGLEAPPTAEEESSFITRVGVGPQHINFGNHADHAFLAETAFHALNSSSEVPGGYISVQYLAEVFLGDVLESYAYRLQEQDKDIDSVILVASRKTTGERKAVLIAQCE